MVFRLVGKIFVLARDGDFLEFELEFCSLIPHPLSSLFLRSSFSCTLARVNHFEEEDKG